MRIAVRLLLGVAAIVWLTPASADVTENSHRNTLWVEDFAPLETAADARAGWFPFEPEEIRLAGE